MLHYHAAILSCFLELWPGLVRLKTCCNHLQDMALVEDCLRENDYKVELAIVEVLQLMSLAEDTCSKESKSFPFLATLGHID